MVSAGHESPEIDRLPERFVGSLVVAIRPEIVVWSECGVLSTTLGLQRAVVS